MEGYNLLTQRLLSEGYTIDNYPDYVHLPGGCWGENPLENLYGGFEYTSEYKRQMVFKTGCGLLLKGNEMGYGSMSYMGILWTIENDNPVISCPYRKDSCELRNSVLGGPHGGGLCKMLPCDCHKTDEPYDYERSCKKVLDDEEQDIKTKYEEFVRKKGGHVCRNHSHYNYWTKEWSMKYDPMRCKDCPNITGNCDLTHQPLSKKKGNVFYDVKITYIRHDGTLFDGEQVVQINKGVRLFETRKSMTVCDMAVKRCKEKILDKEKRRIHKEIFLYNWKVEILNIRAEQRESRDLLQDLQDIRDGIKVIHASDLEKQKKADKKERSQVARQKKIAKLEKKLLDIGYYNLERTDIDKIHADKWLGKKRINELEKIREQKLKEEKQKPVQLSLFDLEDFSRRNEISRKENEKLCGSRQYANS